MIKFASMPSSIGLPKVALAAVLSLLSGLAAAQSLPASVTAAGDNAHIVIGSPLQPLAEVTLAFEDASGLSPASLGVSARLVEIDDPALLARLPDPERTALSPSLPLLITIEPPAAGGLSFRNIGRIEIHTHALSYTPGSSYRVLKAPVGGQFRDVTDEVIEGSVRARSSYGGFSQFLIVTDVRLTSNVIASKLAWLRGRVNALPAGERPTLLSHLDTVETALADGDYAAALDAVDAFSTRTRARAGNGLSNVWSAAGAKNEAGELIAGAATLRFSVAYLRDFGQ